MRQHEWPDDGSHSRCAGLIAALLRDCSRGTPLETSFGPRVPFGSFTR